MQSFAEPIALIPSMMLAAVLPSKMQQPCVLAAREWAFHVKQLTGQASKYVSLEIGS